MSQRYSLKQDLLNGDTVFPVARHWEIQQAIQANVLKRNGVTSQAGWILPPSMQDEVDMWVRHYHHRLGQINRRYGWAWQFCELAIEMDLDARMVLEDAQYRGFWNGTV